MCSKVNLRKRNRFVGFYTMPSIWAVNKPAIETQNYHINYVHNRPLLLEIMDEVVLEYEPPSKEFIIQVCRDGFIKFTNSTIAITKGDIVERWRQILKYLNVLYLLLDSAQVARKKIVYLKFRELARYDILIPNYDTDEFLGYSGPIESYANQTASARTLRTYDQNQKFLSDDRNEYRQIIEKHVFELAFEKFNEVYNARLINELNLISKSLHEYKSGNYEASIVISWSLLENYIGNLYSSQFPKQSLALRIRSYFLKTKYVGTRAQLVALKNSGTFDRELYKRLDSVYKKRNHFIHDLESVSLEKAGQALVLCNELIVNTKTKIDINISFQLNGV